MGDKRKMSCKYNNCKHCGYKSECEIFKENAELKETLRTYNGCGDWDNDFHTCRVYLQHEELQMYADQLIKAKNILRMIVYWKSDKRELLEFINKAEQFLSEAEK